MSTILFPYPALETKMSTVAPLCCSLISLNMVSISSTDARSTLWTEMSLFSPWLAPFVAIDDSKESTSSSTEARFFEYVNARLQPWAKRSRAQAAPMLYRIIQASAG